MDFAIRHFIPGRIRFHIPALRARRTLADKAVEFLRGQTGVRGVRFNPNCASLVVEYEKANDAVLRSLIGRLRSLGVEQLALLIGAAGTKPPSAATAARALQPLPSRRAPLVLPTLSLALAFSANPLVRAINLPLMVWNAHPIALRAWRVWSREGRLNIDFLDVLAVTASLLQGNPLAGAVIAWLIKLGDWIRDLTAAGSRRAIRELLEFQGKTAWVIRDGEVTSVPAAELVAGDEVVVYPGEMIPVDGEVLAGRALIDQRAITGESLPVTRSEGEGVFAASVIQDGQLTIRADGVGDATMAGQIARLVEAAPLGDTRMQNHAERLADRLVMPTLALASGTAALTGDFNRFLSLVIVDYGTGIRVSAPTAMLSSMTQAARAGIVIKSGAHMERLAEADTVVFDKTGTLTHGTPAVIDVIAYRHHVTPDHLLGLAAAAETRLTHPVAEALRRKALELRVNVPPCEETQYRLGLGVEGQVNGYYLHVGNERFMRQCEIRIDASAVDRTALDERGFSYLHVAIDGELVGLIPYADKIRAESRSVIKRLAAMGLRNSVMLTGDNAVVARAVARELGLTQQFAEMLPGDKASVINELRRRGQVVAMVGDGINDSPALSHADVGIAMRHGTEVAHESAHVVLMEDSLEKLVRAVEISRNAVSLIRQNYAIVAGLNTLALALALPGGLVSPVTTALISNGSAILASLNGIRPLIFGRR
jgi:Cu2+-exporting ATPase